MEESQLEQTALGDKWNNLYCSCVQLQKGPVQLPALLLTPRLSDRQQASSVNLKPSELRLSLSRPDISPGPLESSPAQQGLQRCDSEPGLRGILKRSVGSEGSRTEGGRVDSPSSLKQNGGVCGDRGAQGRKEGADVPVAPRRERREAAGLEGPAATAAPWRQRARTRRETIACTPMRVPSEHDSPQEETPRQPCSSGTHSSSTSSRVQ